mmetsp:Transcript_33878/g.59040  ORF Transcript_33878/g.59040 Transcript_33878/m.59040 type:complete len:80 (-) Transcript_33878:848-1087(-)
MSECNVRSGDASIELNLLGRGNKLFQSVKAAYLRDFFAMPLILRTPYSMFFMRFFFDLTCSTHLHSDNCSTESRHWNIS